MRSDATEWRIYKYRMLYMNSISNRRTTDNHTQSVPMHGAYLCMGDPAGRATPHAFERGRSLAVYWVCLDTKEAARRVRYELHVRVGLVARVRAARGRRKTLAIEARFPAHAAQQQGRQASTVSRRTGWAAGGAAHAVHEPARGCWAQPYPKR